MVTFEEDNKAVRKNSNVWVEKYRPQTVKATILSKRYRKFFTQIVEDQEIPNLIIHSNSPGSGKTTIAKALANDCNYDYRYINTSLHRGIDTLRSEISEYASSKSFDKKRKVIILDEFEGATEVLQKALKGAIEEFYDKCRFILTANSLCQIIEPLQSRCQVINFDYTDTDKAEMGGQIVKRLSGIARKEEVEVEDNVLPLIVGAFFPDIRKMINIIAEYSKQYDVIDEKILNFTVIDDELAKLIIGLKLAKARKFILDNGYRHEDLYRYVFDNVIPKCDTAIRGDLYMVTDEYLDKATRSWDQEITFTGYMVSLMSIIGGE